MTLPMSFEQKKESKEAILKDLFRLHQMAVLAKTCIYLSDKDDFNSDYIVMAKNVVQAICSLSQNIDHDLHKIEDAPCKKNKEAKQCAYSQITGHWESCLD